MNAIGKEIEQTKGLLLEGSRLAEAGIDLPQLASQLQTAEKTGKEVEDVHETLQAISESDAAKELSQVQQEENKTRFWNAVGKACEHASVGTANDDLGTVVQIRLNRDDAAMHPDLHAIVLSNMSDADVLRITLHTKPDNTKTLTAELTDAAEICSMPFVEVFEKDGLGMAAREKLIEYLTYLPRKEEQMQDYGLEQQESNFDGLLEELEVE